MNDSEHSFDPSGVEAAAAEQLAREKTEVAADSAEQLIEATETAVESLLSRLSANSLAVEYLTEISVRLRRYLVDEQSGQPSRYARSLLKTKPADDPALAEINRQLVSELNPLLHNLRQAIVEHNAMTQAGSSADKVLEKEGGLVEVLKTGKVKGQKTTGLFGYLEGLNTECEFSLTKLVVVDSLGKNETNVKYWKDRQAARQEVFDREETMPEIIAARSAAAVFELDTISEAAEADGDQELAEATIVLADFIDGRSDSLERDLKKTVNRLSFFRGHPDQMIDLLNAAEVLKQKQPRFFARLLGVSSGRESSEAGRSDLFGNVFHIAFFRSLNRSPRGVSGLPGRQVLRERLNGLLELETKQLPLHHINQEQLDEMQSSLREELVKDQTASEGAPAEKSNPFLVVSLLSGLTESAREKELYEFFRSVSPEEKEKKEGPEAKLKALRVLYKKLSASGSVYKYDKTEAEFALSLVSKRQMERFVTRRLAGLEKARVDQEQEFNWLLELATKNKLDLEKTFGKFITRLEAEVKKFKNDNKSEETRDYGLLNLILIKQNLIAIWRARKYPEVQAVADKNLESEEARQLAIDELEQDFYKNSKNPSRRREIFERIIELGGIEEATGLLGDDNFRLSFDSQEKSPIIRSIIRQAEALNREIEAARWEKECVREARELFGQNFFGPEQIEKAFTIKDEQGQGLKLIDLSPSERAQAEQMLKEELQEPDIKEFFARPENQKDIKAGKYLLILRVSSIKKDGQVVPLTMKAMNELIAPDMAVNNQGKLLFSIDQSNYWYKDETFFDTDTPTFEWSTVTKDVVPSTLNKNHNDQTQLLIEEAKKIGLDQTKIKRRQPVQTTYDHLVSLRTTNQHLLTDSFDRSDIRSSRGSLVGVGIGDSGGLSLFGWSSDDSGGILGASLSR